MMWASLAPESAVPARFPSSNLSTTVITSSNRVSLFAAALAAIPALAQGQVVYVDASAHGTNDGTSWTNARTDLQVALAAASSGTEIWVARGVYRPAAPGGTTISFAVPPGVRVYGSFAGFETSIVQRDIEAHRSVLSGDLLRNDLPGFVNRSDNSERVVSVVDQNGDTLLDGFLVEGAESTGPFVLGAGAGVRLAGVAPRLEHCWIRENRNSSAGGGVYSDASDPRIVACVIENNQSFFDGGGAYLFATGASTERTRFLRNRVLNGFGGGAYQRGGASWHDCLFDGNSAGSGAGLAAVESSGVVSGCTVVANHASFQSGGTGGLEIVGMTVANSILWGNVAPSGSVYRQQIAGPFGPVVATTIQAAAGHDGLDPRFADVDGADGIVGTRDDDLRLLPGSPCIDSGDNTATPANTDHDLDGLRRFYDDPDTLDTGVGTAPLIDRGAHEYKPCLPPTTFCVAAPNTAGPGARMGSSGTAKLYADDLVLRAQGCPPFTFGVFFHGANAVQVPFGNGYRCVSGGVLREGIVAANAAGVAQLAFDASASPLPLAPGVQRHFQFWYRNTAAGGAGFNLSDGLTVRFCP